MDSIKELLDFDRDHLWHPYTNTKDPLPVYPVESASGVKIKLADGRELIDGMSSWWAAIHGYNHPDLNKAVTKQLSSISHIMFGGLTHKPAVELGKKLLQLVPDGLEYIFYSDSGSVAVEVAAKMAIQYMHAMDRPQRNKIATVRGGYHGDTWHAMSVCDPVGGMHSLYAGRLPLQFFAPRPQIQFGEDWNASDFEPMANMLDEYDDDIAAVIIEPIVQGTGGMRFYHPEYLRALRAKCDERGMLLIADEIATGFGRTGRMFACEWAGITPDIMCIGKAITGGYMSFAATIATKQVASTISSGSPSEFMHGPTFMGNPLACAVACESLRLLTQNRLLERIPHIETIIKEELAAAIELPSVKEVRVLGAIGVVEMQTAINVGEIQKRFVDAGVWIRPFGKLLYIMPPFVIDDQDLRTLCRALVGAIS